MSVGGVTVINTVVKGCELFRRFQEHEGDEKHKSKPNRGREGLAM